MKYIRPFFESKSDDYILSEVETLSHIVTDEGCAIEISIWDAPKIIMLENYPRLLCIKIKDTTVGMILKRPEWLDEYIDRLSGILTDCGIDMKSKKHGDSITIENSVNKIEIIIKLIRI